MLTLHFPKAETQVKAEQLDQEPTLQVNIVATPAMEQEHQEFKELKI